MATERQRLVHGHQEISGAQNAALRAQRFAHRFAERDAEILDGVVLVHVQIAFGVDLQIHGAVARHQFEHVIEEANAGRDVRAALPSRFRRRRISVSVVVRWMAGAPHFQYFSSSLALSQDQLRAVTAQLPAAHATRVAAARKHAHKRHARTLARPARRPDTSPR